MELIIKSHYHSHISINNLRQTLGIKQIVQVYKWKVMDGLIRKNDRIRG
jgi:hypothetical protein